LTLCRPSGHSAPVPPLRTFALLFGALLALAALPGLAAGIDALCPERGARCADYPALARLVDEELLPLPDGHPGPLVMPAGGWGQFGRPQPKTPVWNPPGAKRVGLQAGHYKFDEAPPELFGLRRNPGAPGGGRVEWQVTIDLAERAAELLRASGVEVDVLPTTIPVRYRAHAFLAIHVDGDESGRLRGYKVARPNFSSIPDVDDAFAQTTYEEYGRVTGLPDNSDWVTGRMRNYYAFNARRYQHAVAPGVPQAIVETGFMSNPVDRDFLFNRPEVAAQGIAEAVLRFLAADIY
jgi:hypothetical protein